MVGWLGVMCVCSCCCFVVVLLLFVYVECRYCESCCEVEIR